MKIHDPPMTFRDLGPLDDGVPGEPGKKYWEDSLSSITPEFLYGNAIHRYASEWATRMEDEYKVVHGGVPIKFAVDMRELNPNLEEWLKEHAERLSQAADDEGITGFMYGSAVHLLKRCWVAGDALNDWHNAKYEKPKGASGTVNPAILEVVCTPAPDDGQPQ
jgi:hypothetical protein